MSLFGPPEPTTNAGASEIWDSTNARVPHPSQSHRDGWDVGLSTNAGAPDLSSETGVPNPPTDPACRLGLAATEDASIEVSLDTPGIKQALADPALPKDLHDLKAVLRALAPHGVELAGVRDDVMLLSYLVNPTHGSHTLPDIAARTTSRALIHQATKLNPSDPNRLPEAAAAIVRLVTALRAQMEEAGTFEHHIPKDDPALGGAVTPEMLVAKAPTRAKMPRH